MVTVYNYDPFDPPDTNIMVEWWDVDAYNLNNCTGTNLYDKFSLYGNFLILLSCVWTPSTSLLHRSRTTGLSSTSMMVIVVVVVDIVTTPYAVILSVQPTPKFNSTFFCSFKFHFFLVSFPIGSKTLVARYTSYKFDSSFFFFSFSFFLCSPIDEDIISIQIK